MIKNVIFDFGNVLFDLKLDKLKTGLQNLMDDAGKERLRLLFESGFFKRYEVGAMSTASFLETLRRCPTEHIEREDVQAVWNSIFVDFPQERLDMLLELRKTYKLYLLSNINDLHLTWIENYLLERYNLTDFEERYFDQVFYSHLIHLRKPDANIYEHVLRETGITAEESIFFDDLVENIEAAEAIGIQGAHHEVGRDIIEHLQSRQIL